MEWLLHITTDTDWLALDVDDNVGLMRPCWTDIEGVRGFMERLSINLIFDYYLETFWTFQIHALFL